MGKSKSPPAPDYTAAAKETAAGNLEMAQYATNANRINQITPYGSLTYSYQPQYDAQGRETGAGWTQTESLTPQAQAALDQQLALNQKYGEVANKGFDSAQSLFENPQLNTSGIPQGATGINLSGLPGGGQQMTLPGQAASFSTSGLPALSSGPDLSSLPKFASGGISSGGASVDLNGLPSRGINAGQTAVEAIMSRLQPQLAQQEEALRTRLANQGIGLQSEAYGREQNLQGQRANDLQLQAAAQGISVDEMVRQNAFNEQMGQASIANQNAQMNLQAQIANASLANQARQQAYNEQMGVAGLNRSDRQQLYNESLGAFGLNQSAQNDAFNQMLQANQYNQGLQNQALQNQMAGQGFNQNIRQQALAEQAYLQDRPLNLINALRSGNQVQSPQFQQFAQQATTQGADILGAQNAQYQAALAQNNAQNAGTAGLFGGLAGIGMGLAGLPTASGGSVGGNAIAGLFSDHRLKTNIKRVGTLDNGLGVYSYRYIWGGPTHIGVMAQEVEKVIPEAVFEVDGFKAVNYAGL